MLAVAAGREPIISLLAEGGLRRDGGNLSESPKSSQYLCITAAEVMRLTNSLMNEARLEGDRLRVFHAPRALPLLGWTLC